MLFWRLSMFCTLMIVRRSSQSSLDVNFGCFSHPSIHSKTEREEENTQGELYRQKCKAVTLGISSTEYTIAIEINIADSSLQNNFRSYLKKLSFPLLLNVSDSSVKIPSINVTTECNSTGTDSTNCYCEHGYEWPAEACASNPTCPKATAAEESCNCIAQLPPQGTYCQLHSEDTSMYIIQMSVRLDQPFQDDLQDSSSTLFKKYKHDLEEAFIAGYSSLPGFKNVSITGFRPGSIVVPYTVIASRDIPVERANSKIAATLKDYNLMNNSFQREIPGAVNFSVSPERIFEGDTVKMTCESKSVSRNVSWSFSEHFVSTNTRHSIMNDVTDGKSISTLTITSIQLNEAGNYTCAFEEWGTNLTLIYNAVENIAVFQLHIVPSENVSIVCNGESKELRCCIDTEIELTSYWKPNGAINISGSSTSINNCTTYVLQANESQCPADKSGTKTDYTCELNSTYGARNYSVIGVTYFRLANVNMYSKPNGKVSEGHNFSVNCISDVSNYDEVTWQIQNGKSIKKVDNLWYTTTKSERGAMSVLTVGSANQDWAGIYICTFFQSFLNSSAHLEMEIVPLPLQQNIIRDPINISVSCPVTQDLKCCTHKKENYTVVFYDLQMPQPVLAERRQEGSLNCYYYTLWVTGDRCNIIGHGLQTFCEFSNQINDSVRSSPMILNLVPVAKIRCNSSVGVGENGSLITKPCLPSNEKTTPVRGNIIYKCDDAKWTIARNNCLAVLVNNLLSSAEDLVSSPESVQNLPTYLESLDTTIKKEQQNIKTSVADLKAVVEILNMVSIIPVDANHTTMEHFLSTVDTVMTSPRETWKHFKNGSSQLLDSVERFSESLRPLNDTIPLIRHDNIQLEGAVIGKNNGLDYNKSFVFPKSAHLSGSVLIDETKINRTGTSISTIISVAYSAFGHINPQYNKKADLVINGLVLTTVVGPTSKLSNDFQINMTFAKSEKNLKNPRCVFWNFSFSADGGGWDDAGCESREDEHWVTCSCNHLTSFSILMSPSHEDSWDALTYITYVGLGISILSLVTCIGIELAVWKSVTKTRISYMRHVCILNIAISLLIADIWFIIVAVMHDKNYEVNQHICTAATFFIHYFYLCVFFWMLTLGLMLFYHLVFILHNTSKTVMKAVSICLGYVCPLAISVITIASTLSRGSYTKKTICLLNWENSKALLALVIPALIIVALNAIVTIVVIAKISRRSIGEKSISEEKKSLYRIAKSIGVLTPLLGLTWGFGFATVFPESPTVFHILFNIFNSFQGLFILLCGTFWDMKVREAILNKCSLSRWSSQHTKSTSRGISAPMLSISSPFSRTLNNLFGKAGKYQVSSTESVSSSENTSKTYSLLT